MSNIARHASEEITRGRVAMSEVYHGSGRVDIVSIKSSFDFCSLFLIPMSTPND